MSNFVKDVQIFMNAAGHTIDQNNLKQSELYKRLIDEEYSEFLEAWNNKDDTEQLDACFDMIWVIIGFILSRGWDANSSWNEGALSNLRKIDKESGKLLKRADGKVLKPEGWQPPDFGKFVK